MINTRTRVIGFVTALGASVALVAAAAGSTGAYFTDSVNGTATATVGSIQVESGTTSLSFAGLLPGENKDQKITYSNSGSGNEDVWLVFPRDTPHNQRLNSLFTGSPEEYGEGGQGRYGHFAVTDNVGNLLFTSYNLSRPRSGASLDSICETNQFGHGGSAIEAANRADYTVDYCPVPDAIKLSSNLAPGAWGDATLTFGYTKLLTDQTKPALEVPFQIVATQVGISPSDVNNYR
jgi:hypothetical protein